MLRTKHVAIAVVFLVVAAATVFLYALFASESTKDAVLGTVATFVSDDVEYNAVTLERTDTDEIRMRLQRAIGEKVAQSDLEEHEVSVEDDTAVEDTTTVSETSALLGLGDGRISSSPQQGYIYACQNAFSGGGGTSASPPWIIGDSWNPEEKVVVDGNISQSGEVSIEKIEGARLIRADGIPNHMTGVFPISTSDDAFVYDKNPNTVTAQNIVLQVAKIPTLADAPSCVPMGPIGIGLNGVAIFNGLDAMGRDAAAHEVLDVCEGHPQQKGMYHYHSESECLTSGFYEGADSTVIGYALDGFGIFSGNEYGETVTNEDLDACHGHTHTIPWDGELRNMYHYHMTEEYPYSVGCFMGAPNNIINDVSVIKPVQDTALSPVAETASSSEEE
jgi:hypothetical protein